MDASNHRAESLEVPPYSSGYGTSMPGASCSYSKPYGDAGEEESMIDPEVQPLLQKRVLDKKKGTSTSILLAINHFFSFFSSKEEARDDIRGHHSLYSLHIQLPSLPSSRVCSWTGQCVYTVIINIITLFICP